MFENLLILMSETLLRPAMVENLLILKCPGRFCDP